jgi:Putative peptidoglycan binding domain
MTMSYQRLLKDLERELFLGESEGESFAAASAGSGPLRSIRFAADPELQAVARGQLQLGRSNDPGWPAPIRSQGARVRKVQRALIDLGFALPLNGDDGRYGQETYNAVLAYKRQYNIRTASGYLDGIVGPKTMTRLDAQFPAGPLPACSIPGSPVVANAEGEFGGPATSGGIPWFTCDPRLDPSPTGMCNQRLPDHGTLESEGGGAVSTSLVGGFYCVNQPRVHLGFIATWVEMLPPAQRPPGQRNRSANAPRYDVSFKGYREEGLEPGRRYARDITVSAPGIGSLDFLTSLQRNRLIRIEYTISESAP